MHTIADTVVADTVLGGRVNNRLHLVRKPTIGGALWILRCRSGRGGTG